MVVVCIDDIVSLLSQIFFYPKHTRIYIYICILHIYALHIFKFSEMHADL
jgi:hypothetical protein